MSIFHKSTIDHSLEELEQHYAALKDALKGKPLNADELMRLNIDPESKHVPQLVRININDVLDAVGFFKVAVDNLRRLKSRAVKP